MIGFWFGFDTRHQSGEAPQFRGWNETRLYKSHSSRHEAEVDMPHHILLNIYIHEPAVEPFPLWPQPSEQVVNFPRDLS